MCYILIIKYWKNFFCVITDSMFTTGKIVMMVHGTPFELGLAKQGI